jgi:hypothetical protein
MFPVQRISPRNVCADPKYAPPLTDGGSALRIAGSYAPMSSTTWSAVAHTQPVSAFAPIEPEQGVTPSRGHT